MSGEHHNPTSVPATMARLLTFRSTRDELLALNSKHLIVGLVCAWLVGIGRYWDNPKVCLVQHLGVGSVIYVFVMAALLWLFAAPMRPKDWTYFRVCTFVALVSPPAILYAIPVERFLDLETANNINAWFLFLVAAWRVALFFFFLRRLGELGRGTVLITALVPLMFVVILLTALNLEKVVFDFMGGFHERSANDGAYGILFLLSTLSGLLFLPVVLVYAVMALNRRQFPDEYDG